MARKLEIQIVGDASSLERAFGRAANSGSSFGSKMAKAGKMAGVAFVAMGAAAAAGLASSAKAAIDFEKAMRNVNSIASLSEGQFKDLNKSVLAMAQEVGQKPKVLAEGLYDIVSSGFKANDAIKILKASAIAATAGMTDTATATKAVTAALNAYHMGAGKARKVSDVLFQTVNLGVLTFEELSQQMGDLVPVAAPLGVRLEEVGAAMATLTKQGVPAAEAATRVKSVMVQLAKPSKELAALFKEQGFASGEAAVKSLGFAGVLEMLAKATGGSVSETAKLTPEIRSLMGVVGLTGRNLKDYQANLKAMDEATRGAGITAKVFAEQQKSFAVQWQKMGAAIDVLKIGIGNALLPVLNQGITKVNAFMAEFNKADGAAAKFQVAMKAVKAIVAATIGELKAINWGEVWNQIIISVEQVSPRVAAALSTLGTATKTVFDGLSTSWGQFIAASLAGAAVFAQAASRVVAAIKAIQVGMLTLNPLFTALTILAGLTAGALYMIVTRGNEVSAALKKAESALNALKGAAEGAKGAEQNLAEAKNRLGQATLSVTAAIKAKQAAVAAEGAGSLAAKQAENAVEAAYLGRRRAAMDVKSATEALDAAQKKSKTTSDTVKTSVKNLTAEYDALIAKGPSLQSSVGRIGVDQEKLNAGFERQSAKKFAADMTALATEAGKTAKELQKTDPALAAIARGVEKAAKSQAKMALEMGKIPGAVKKLEGPGKQAGTAVGEAIGAGMKAGIASSAAAVAAAAAGLVSKAYGAASTAAQMHSPSRLFATVGEMMGAGIGVGFDRSTTSVAATISGKTKSLVTAAIGEVKRLQGVLDGINNAQAAKDRARAVTDAQAAVAEARKKGEGVAAAERELARARQDIVVASLESQLAKEQAVLARRQAAHEAAMQKFQAIYDAAMSRYQSAIDRVADFVSRSFQAKTDSMVAAVGAKFDKLVANVQAAGAKLTAQEKALQAFDQQAVPQTDSEKALAALDAAEAERGRQAAVAAAQIALANAQQITDTVQKAEAIKAAEEQLRVAELGITRAKLEEQAAAERAARDIALAEKRAGLAESAEASRIARDAETAALLASLEADKTAEINNLTERRNQRLTKLQQQLADLKTWLGKHPKEYEAINKKVTAIMDAFGVTMKGSGQELGNAFAAGLRSSIGEVERAARAVAQAAANNLKLNSPAKEGPMSDLDKWWKALPATLLSGLDTRLISSALSGAVGMPAVGIGFGGAAPSMAVPRAGSGNTYNFHFPNYVGDKREILRVIQTEFDRNSARNS